MRGARCAGEEIERAKQDVRRDLGEAIVERSAGLVRQDREFRLQEHVAGIETFVHVNDGDACFASPAAIAAWIGAAPR